MAEPTISEASGLQLSNNTFSASPPGSMSKATNGVISRKGVFEPRNGQERASTLPAAADLPFQCFEFQGNVLANYGTSKTDTSMGLGRVSSGTISAYSGGPYNPLGNNGSATDYMRLHPVFASLFLHFCCATTPKTLEAYNGTPRNSGLTRVPDLEVIARVPTGTQPGVVPYNSSVAYRFAHKRITSTGQVLVSPLSNRFVLTNRFQAAVGGLTRTATAGGTVTVTISQGQIWNALTAPFPVTATFTLTAVGGTADANFPEGTKTIASGVVNSAFTYLEAGANVSSTVAYELNPGAIYGRASIKLPVDAVAGDYIQLFKSVATSDSSIEPSEDVYLCGEHLLTSGDISAASITMDDYTPQSVLKDPAYTNPSDGDGQGEAGQNFPPPLYQDAANYDSHTFYLGTVGQQYMDIQMLGVGGPDGVQDGDTLTVNDTATSTAYTFTFRNNPSVGGDVRLISDGTPAYNIAWTSFFLARAAVTAGSDLRAAGIGVFAGTAVNGFPGGIRIERTDYKQNAFQVKASRPKSWSPALQSSAYLDSFGQSQPNGLAWGKLGQPEAVPTPNNSVVGVPNYYGRRCFGLRNSLIILKEGDGIWSLTGTGGNYSLQQISLANTIAPDCACVFADSVWAYTDQGILRISDTGGTAVVSRPIETELNALAAEFPTETYAWSFAIPYETERRVMFFVPFAAASSETGGAPLLKAWCYSQATNAWTGPLVFNGAPVSGFVATDHKLWVGLFDDTFSAGRLTKERRTGTYLDIADDAWSNTLTTTADPLVVELATAGDIQQGTGISQDIGGVTYRTKVAEVLGGGQYQLEEEIPWANGACTVYDCYEVEAQFLPSGSPGSRKVLTRLFTLYKPESFANFYGSTTIFTDQMQDEDSISAPGLGFGLNPFGGGSFGDPSPMVVDSNPIKPQWVNAGQFFPGFKLNEVWAQLKLQGVGMRIEGADAPVGRGK